MTALLVVMVLSGVASAGPPGKPAKDARVAAVAAALAEIRDGARPCRDLRVRYRDGSDAFGWTVVSVARTWARVERTEPGAEPQVFRGPLGREMCLRIARNAADARLWKVRRRRREVGDDETEPLIRMGVAGVGSFTVRTWGFDVQDQTAFAVARGQLLVLATRLSHGVVTY